MRQLLAFALKRLPGVSITEAANGVDGLKKITGERFDLIFTDINMPVMDGLKLVGLVRKDPALANIPIVVISTEGAEEDRNRAFALGANDYITKPVQSPQVQEVARRLLMLK
jgi:two-component system chemotaxis response regulator CheY